MATILSSEQLLLLHAALDEQGSAVSCFDEWWKRVDIKNLGHTEYRLLPLVYSNIGQFIHDKIVAARVKGVAKHVWLSNQRVVHNAAQVLDALAAVEIPHMLLKGAAMMAGVYTDLMRGMDDCDILVPAEQIPKTLTELAKHELSRQLTVSDLTQHHAIALRRSGEHFSVDIHGRPLRDVRAEELSNEFFRHAVLCEFDDHKTHRPCYEHMLLHTIVHGTEWALEPRYDWLADAVMILRAAESGFDWNFLSACAGRYRLGPIVGQALRKLAQTFAIAIPHAVLATLSRGDVVDQIEARQRAKGPVRHFSHRLVGTLQQVRRQDVGLAGRSVFASMPALWKKRYGSPALTQFADRVDGDESVFYLSGWHVPEDVDPPGRWTDGSSAVLAIRRASGRSGRLLRLSGFAIQTDRNHPQVIDLHAGWRRLARLRRHTQDREIDLIPLPSALHERELIILRLRIRRPLSPAAIGRSPDVRQLGFFLQDIRATSSIRDASSVPLKIHNNSSDIAILWSGWSRPEADGCWSDGAEASLLWTSPSDLPANARVIMSGQIFATDQPLTGSVFVNGHRVDRPLVMNSGPVNLSVPLSAIRGDREIHIGLRFDNPRSPRDLGISSDNRRLGLFLQTVFIEVNG